MAEAPKRGSNDVAPTHEAPAEKDVVFVHGATEDGEGLGIVRLQGDRVQAGELRPAKDGQPIHGELVALSPRPESERLFDVEVLARGPGAPAAALPQARAPVTSDVPAPTAARAAHKGPALVNSEAYRDGWDAVFGRSRRGPAN